MMFGPASRCDERGQSTVELALCVPIVALLLAAVVEVGLVVADQGRVWHAAREAARVATVDDDHAQIQAAVVRTGLKGAEILVEPRSIYRRQGEPVTVSLRYRPPGHVPLIRELVDSIELRAEATMRVEQP